MWESGFRSTLISETQKIKMGPCSSFEHFLGPVIGQSAYDRITDIIKRAEDAGGEIIAGGKGDDSKGWFVEPTVIVTKDPKSVSMVEEIFGPVMTVSFSSLH